MAKFKAELPQEIIREFDNLYSSTDKMLEEMTKAGAEVVYKRMRAGCPPGLSGNLVKTRTYKTPSDDGINTKVMIAGYFTNHKGQKVPAPLVANVFEYGRSGKPFPRKPFMRKAFNKGAITKAMLAVQDKYIKG